MAVIQFYTPAHILSYTKYETQNYIHLYRPMDTYSYRPSQLYSTSRHTMTKHKQQTQAQNLRIRDPQAQNHKQTRHTTSTTKRTTQHKRIKPPLFYDSDSVRGIRY